MTGRLAVGVLVCVATLTSCAGVDATEDFRETAREIRARTGSPDAWAPDTSAETIAAAVGGMLGDGLLTVDEAVRVCLLHNPVLRASFMDVGIARADLVEAGRPRNPLVAFSARFPEGGGLVNLTLSISQSLMDLLLIPARTRSADVRLAAARAATVRQAVILAGRVEGEVLDLAALGRAREAAADSLALALRQQELARQRLDAGLGDVVDVHLAGAAVLDAKSEMLVVERELDVGRAALTEDLGLDAGAPPWQVAGDLTVATDPLDSDALVAAALVRRIDVALAGLAIESAMSDLDLERDAVIEELMIGFERERPETPPSLAGPTLETTLPVFGLNEPAVARGEFRLAAARSHLARVRHAVTREVRAAAARLRGARERVALFEGEILPGALAGLDAARRAWEAGEREILVVLEAQRFLVEQRRRHAGALRDAARARAALHAAMGGPFGSGFADAGGDER